MPDELNVINVDSTTVPDSNSGLTPIGVNPELGKMDWVELSAEENQRLEELETIIRAGMIGVFQMGLALAEIRDCRLYRSSHPTFDDYCRDLWGLSKSHVNRRIDAAKVAQNLTPIGVKLQRESHARPLAKLPPDQQRQAMQLALSFDEPLTAKTVTEAASKVLSGEAEAPKRLNNPDAHNEFPTPDKVLERVYKTLGVVDLDPCSEGGFPPNVQASCHYTRDHDGLAQDWFGKVFCNPPYTSGELLKWTGKLLTEFKSGRVTEALYLVPNYTAEKWHQLLRDYPRGHFKGRLKFKGQPSPARFSSVIFYLGHNTSSFGAAFADLCDFYLLSDLED